jgi:transposase
MIYQWKRALLDGAAAIFERGGKTAPVVDENTVRSLHAKIGELAVAIDSLSRLKPWIGQRGAG